MEENKNTNYAFGSEKFYKAIAPNVITTKKGVVYFNTEQDSEDNAFPEMIVDVFNAASSTHSNFINLKKNMITGANLVPVTPDPELEAFLKQENKAGDNWYDIYEKAANDMALFEAVSLQCLYDSEGNIPAVYHVGTEKIRAMKPTDLGTVETYLISDRWGDISNKKNRRASEKTLATTVPAFHPASGVEDGRQLMYIKRYSSGSKVYAIPSYSSGLIWANIDNELSKYHYNRTSKGFYASGLLVLRGQPDEEQKRKFIRDFENKYIGNDGTKKMVYVWTDSKEDAPEFVKTESDSGEGGFLELEQIASQKIATAHGGNLELAGIEGKGVDLGGDANKLNTSLLWYYKTVVKPMQDTLLKGINKILKVNGFGEVEVPYVPLIDPNENTVEEEAPVDETELEEDKKKDGQVVKEIIKELELN